MGLKRRLAAAGVIAIAVAFTVGVAYSGMQVSEKQETPVFSAGKETLYLWYTDDALSSYLSSAAVTYNETHDVRVVPVLESGLEYLENINDASLEGSSVPDMYIVSHDSLGKAYLAGLTSEVKPADGVVMENTYIGTGLQAASYKDKVIGYPFYFETSSFLYNKSYLRDMAGKWLEAEADRLEGEAAQAIVDAMIASGQEITAETGSSGESESGANASGGSDAEQAAGLETEIHRDSSTGWASDVFTGMAAGWEAALWAVMGSDDSGKAPGDDFNGAPEADLEEELTESGFLAGQVEAKMQELLPSTIADIEAFADNYDAPEQVEGVFKWDVTDIFYNYFFVGNSIQMGGEAGFDTSKIDIYNRDAIESMRVYQDLNQFFSIDTHEIEYEAILEDFMAGKMVFTVATTDAVSRLEHAKQEGLFDYEYGVSLIPDVSENQKSRSLSVTNCVVVNGYSEKKEAANDFAYFLTSQYNDILYARAGKVSAAKGVAYDYEALDHFEQEYERSISMPKMIETSNFWVKLEVVFSQVWNGADANEKLKELSEQMMSQITGMAYEEEYLEELEEPEEQEEEYLDEEDYQQEPVEEGQD